jgi:PAP2 superfamily.
MEYFPSEPGQLVEIAHGSLFSPGERIFFLILLPALSWCVEASVGLRVGVVLLVSTSVNDALKMALHGPRPYGISTDVIGYASETSFGIPSGHAQIAVGVWGMMAASLRKWWH